MIALGMSEGEIYIVIYTRRDNVYRLITACKGGQRDREEYEKSKPK